MSETGITESYQSVGEALAGKYLTFSLSEEVYGLPILKVHEIIGMMAITKVPKSPDYLKGVVNLRGRIIPIVDLRQKFKMPHLAYGERTCIIVVDVKLREKNLFIGVVVDTVLEVVSFEPRTIEEAPQYGNHLDTSFILGIGRSPDNKVVILLDGDRSLQDGEQHLVAASK